MATLMVENVPESEIKRYGHRISFSEIIIRKKKLKVEKDPTIFLQKLVDDPENTSYGPFEGEEVSDYLKSLMK